jgi:hypothetical protein
MTLATLEAIKEQVHIVPLVVDPEELRSDFIPADYQTVGNWWRLNAQQAFRLLDDPVATLTNDAAALERICEDRGIEVKDASPSRIAQKFGFETSRAFPIRLVWEYFSRIEAV